MVVAVMCTYVSWCPWVCVCLSVGLCVAAPASAIGCSRLQYSYYCIPSRRSTTHPSVCCRYYCVAYGGSYIPWDPMYPPEVGYLGSLAMLHPMGVKYRAARLRYVALC